MAARSFERDGSPFAVELIGAVVAHAAQRYMLLGDPTACVDPARAGHRLFDIEPLGMERSNVHITHAAEAHCEVIRFKMGNILACSFA